MRHRSLRSTAWEEFSSPLAAGTPNGDPQIPLFTSPSPLRFAAPKPLYRRLLHKPATKPRRRAAHLTTLAGQLY